jgi:hypothetical protein
MWKYTEINAYNTISLHDCKASVITMEGSDLIFDFPDGFWITPLSSHSDHDCPIKTGPAQLCIHGIFEEAPFDTIDIYKTIHILGKPVFCRRLQPEYPTFLKMFQTGKYDLEFITEYHTDITSLYQCWIWKKDSGVYAECQFELTAKSIEYRWNEIRYEREW